MAVELRDRYQFGVLPLLALMTLIAASLAAIRFASLPMAFRVGLGVYAVLMSIYLTLRVPYALRHLRGTSARWKKIRADRVELEEMIRRHKERRVESSPPSGQAATDREDGGAGE